NGDLPESALSTLRSLVPRWEDPRTRSLAEQSNFVATQIGVGNMVPGTEATLRELGLDSETVRIMAAEVRAAKGESNFAQYLAANSAPAAAEPAAAPSAEPSAEPATEPPATEEA